MHKPVNQAGIGGSHSGTPSSQGDSSTPLGVNPRLARLEKLCFSIDHRAHRVELVASDGGAVAVLVVGSEAGGGWAFSAFVNRCSHARWPLDRFDGTVLFDDTGALMCAAHFAVFDPISGSCLGGPGLGRPLIAVPVVEDGDCLVIGPLPDHVLA